MLADHKSCAVTIIIIISLLTHSFSDNFEKTQNDLSVWVPICCSKYFCSHVACASVKSIIFWTGVYETCVKFPIDMLNLQTIFFIFPTNSRLLGHWTLVVYFLRNVDGDKRYRNGFLSKLVDQAKYCTTNDSLPYSHRHNFVISYQIRQNTRKTAFFPLLFTFLLLYLIFLSHKKTSTFDW